MWKFSVGALCAAGLALAAPGAAQASETVGYQVIFTFEDAGDLDGMSAATGLETHFSCSCTLETQGAGLDAHYPPYSGSHVVVTRDFVIATTDPLNISWPALAAYVTGGATVYADFYAYDPDQQLNVLVASAHTSGANYLGSGGGAPNEYLGLGSDASPQVFTRAHFYSTADFTLDDVTLGLVDVGPGVPEPAAWILMLGGFGLAGQALRRRSRLVAG